MKKIILKKTAGLLALLMVLTLAMPVLASAAVSFDNLVYKDGTVTGDVYVDDQTIGDTGTVFNVTDRTYGPVSVSVYDPEGNFLSTVEATYSEVYNNKFSFHFSQDVDNSFNYLELLETVTNSVYADVYNTTDNGSDDSGSHHHRGGGGGFLINSVNGNTITVSGDSVSASDLASAFADSKDIVVNFTGDHIALPASALKDAPAGATIKVVNDEGTYTLPIAALDFDWMKTATSSDLANISVKVTIAKVTGSDASKVSDAVQAAGGTQDGDAIEFNVSAVGVDKEVDITSYGNVFATRTTTLDGTIDPSKATGVVYDPATGSIQFVPSTFSEEDGKTVASFMRNGNSIYTVVTSDKSFSDISADYWGADAINLLANKLITSGVSDDQFAPTRNITRAEFAGLLVRSLGLDTSSAKNTFTDVADGQWYTQEVATAAQAGLVYGYNNEFRPNDLITRQELAAMVVRAMEYAGKSSDLSTTEQADQLAKFLDVSLLGSWAQADVAAAVKNGIVYGISTNQLAPLHNASRAEAVAMVQRYLDKVGFIN